VIFEGRRAIGVEYVQAGHRQTMHADREVILCGGAYNSPQLLMLSGIGPADDLAKHGIVTIQDLPGVGRNLQDHASVGVDCEMSQPWGFDHALRADRFAVSVLRWLASRTGPATALPVIGGAFIRTRPELERPDVQMLFTSVARDAHVWFPGIRRNKGHMLVNRAVLLHPDSRGHVALRSADPLDKPRITLNLLEHESDLATLRLALRKTREVLAQGPFDSLRGVELAPGSAVQSDDEIDTYIRRTVATAFHPVGTCAMGIGTGAVTDAQLRVHGVENLRVADASVMPTIIGGNTNAPTIMIGEKAADLVLGKG
jgi:choline dehydrogenase